MEKAKGVKWDLSFLYDGTEDPKIEEHLKRGDELANEFVVNYRDKIASSEFNTKMLMEALEAMEKVYSFATRPYHYAMLKFSEDTQNPQNQALLAKVQQSFTVTNNKLVFFNVELMKMPDATADTIMADPEFAHYKHWLAEARKNKPYTLSEKEEQVINLKDSTGKSALVQLYEEYTGDFDFEMEVDGEMKTMTGEEVASYFTSEEPEASQTRL
ncbi:MAG: hypothetical protein U5N86_13555 [Planctomycetota bacterium]|nr:hypothetical protein [Planctomycetota bacterium]